MAKKFVVVSPKLTEAVRNATASRYSLITSSHRPGRELGEKNFILQQEGAVMGRILSHAGGNQYNVALFANGTGNAQTEKVVVRIPNAIAGETPVGSWIIVYRVTASNGAMWGI